MGDYKQCGGIYQCSVVLFWNTWCELYVQAGIWKTIVILGHVYSYSISKEKEKNNFQKFSQKRKGKALCKSSIVLKYTTKGFPSTDCFKSVPV